MLEEKGDLKRELGLFSAVNLIFGEMIGSGIFVSPAAALAYSGSVGLCLIIWTLSGIIALLGALAFAELGIVVGKSGAEYSYFEAAFGKMHKFWGPLPSFICAWIYVVVLRPAEVAVIIMTFAEYAVQPFKSLGPEFSGYKYVILLTSLVALFTVTYVNYSSVKLLVKMQNIFGAFKVAACVIVIGGGIYELAIGNTENLSSGFANTTKSPGKIALAFYSGLWAYDGWNSVTVVTEEIINPARNVPLSIIIAVPLITALYVFMNVAYMTVLSYDEMTNVTAVAVAFGDKVLGPASFLIPVGVAIATYGCALSIQFGVSRVCLKAAKGGHMLEVFSYVHIKNLTPAPAVVLQGVLAAIVICIGDINHLIEFASWYLWVFYGMAMVALLVLRRTQPDTRRNYRVPTPIPVLVLLVAIYLSVLPIIQAISVGQAAMYLIEIGLLVIGVIVYTIFVYYKKTPRQLLDKFTLLVQKLLMSAPPTKAEDHHDQRSHRSIPLLA